MYILPFLFKNLFFTGIFTVLINLFALALPVYLLVVANTINSGSTSSLIMQTIIALAVTLYMVFLEVVRKKLLVGTSQQLGHRYSGQLIKHMLERNTGTNEEHASLKDLHTIKQMLSGRAMIALLDAPWFLLFLSVIYAMNHTLGAIATVGVLIVIANGAVSIGLNRKLVKKAEQSGKRADEKVGHALSNQEVTYSMGMSDAVMKRWEKHAESAQNYSAANEQLSGGFLALGNGIRLGLQVTMIFSAAYLIITTQNSVDKQVHIGVLFAATILLGKMLAPVEAFTANIPLYINAWSAFSKLRKFTPVTDEPARFRDLSTPGKVAVRDLLVQSPTSRRLILKGINLGIPAGETLAIIGPSGAGKSTLVKTIVGTQIPSGGQVLIDDSPIATWSAKERQASIGYLPQNSGLLPGTVAENISRLAEPDAQLVIDAARVTGIDAMIRNLPNGYDTLIGPGGLALSAGEQQRVALARTIYGSPRLVILDEPNASIDAEGERALFACLEILKQRGTTVIIITHRPGILTGVNRVAVMEKGMIKDIGKPEAILRALSKVHAENVQTRHRATQELNHV